MLSEKRHGFLDIQELGFWGAYSESRNGQYTVAWESSGRFILVKGENLLSSGKLHNPTDGKVSDFGIHVLADSLNNEKPESCFCAFDSAGHEILRQNYTANIVSIGVARSGAFAAVQTALSETDDAALLCLADLNSRMFCWKQSWGMNWARDYDFDEENKRLILIYPELGRFAFSYTGEFLDRDLWNIERVRLTCGKELVDVIRQLIASGEVKKKSGEVLAALEYLRAKEWVQTMPKHGAIVYRCIGEVQEALGNLLAAIESYKRAAALDPKVGVKKRLDALARFGV